jgi:hypothetical protein
MDIIIIQGFEYWTNSLPLEHYWNEERKRPSFCNFCNPPKSDYHAKWVIENLQLFLIDFHGENQLRHKEYFLKDIFPQQKGLISADWFSGDLIIPMGKEIPAIHFEFPSSREYSTTITIQKGFVIDPGVFDLK